MNASTAASAPVAAPVAATQRRRSSPFGKGAVLALLLVGFGAFITLLYFLGMGDGSNLDRPGASHASANGLNGYSALAKMLDAEGMEVTRGRTRESLETSDLLILTPPGSASHEEVQEILENRRFIGPTMVILPKWMVYRIGDNVAEKDQDKVRRDWVQLDAPFAISLTDNLPPPFTMELELELDEGKDRAGNPRWGGLGLSGELPTKSVVFAKPQPGHEPVIVDDRGRALAVNVLGEEGTDFYDNAQWVTFVVEPDLMNNYGMADAARAAAALSLVREAGYQDMSTVTFDMTMHGAGETTNLLTLAFTPPFLAATLCLLLAMFIIAWRAFLRFGPPALAAPAMGFGKERLVRNGADLIVRAKRLGLLARPYARYSQRRLAKALGLTRADAEAIDAALAVRLPDQVSFSARLAQLEEAQTPADILHAAQALDELTRTLKR